mgnify:CR=1 FL=1
MGLLAASSGHTDNARGTRVPHTVINDTVVSSTWQHIVGGNSGGGRRLLVMAVGGMHMLVS